MVGSTVTVTTLSGMPTGWLVWQRAGTAPVLTVACRATFTLAPGEAKLTPRQEPLAAREQGYSDGLSRGLYAPCDLVPMKPRADVVVVGHAFAAGREPVRSLIARLVVAGIDKTIEVHQDRRVNFRGEVREGPMFSSMPLVWERSQGDPNSLNPIGVNAQISDADGHMNAPNFQSPGAAARGYPLIGFGPIASNWPTRSALLGATLSERPPTEWNGQVMPADLDPLYFQVAPHDQQVQALAEDERIVLQNLHPRHPELVTHLPGLRPRVFLETTAGEPREVIMRVDTLWIDTSREICTVTWRGQIALPALSPTFGILTALESPGRPLGWDDLKQMATTVKSAASPKDRQRETIELPEGSRPRSRTLPFAPSSPEQLQPHTSPTAVALAAERRAILAAFSATEPPVRHRVGAFGETADADLQQAVRAALPFVPPPQGPTSAPLAPGVSPWARPPRALTGTTDADLSVFVGPVLLFSEPAPDASLRRIAAAPPAPLDVDADRRAILAAFSEVQPVRSLATPVRAGGESGEMADAGLQYAVQAARPFVPPSQGSASGTLANNSSPLPRAPKELTGTIDANLHSVLAPALGLRGQPLESLSSGMHRGSEALAATTCLSPQETLGTAHPSPPGAAAYVAPDVAPPPMLGPLAWLNRSKAAPVPTPQCAAAEAPSDYPGVTEVRTETEPKLPLLAFPLERCARIAASIARSPAKKSAILQTENTDPKVWTELDKHWMETIAEETRRGKSNLLNTYDEAYVAQLEAERGAITVNEYARISVAAEREIIDSVLRDLTIPASAWMRIRRHWIARTVADGELGAQVRNALDAERNI